MPVVVRGPEPAGQLQGRAQQVPQAGDDVRVGESGVQGERDVCRRIRDGAGTQVGDVDDGSPDREDHDEHDRDANQLDELIPSALHTVEQYANNPVEADHGRLKARLRPMRGLKRHRSARTLAVGHCAYRESHPWL
jgi:hypothetical protein